MPNRGSDGAEKNKSYVSDRQWNLSGANGLYEQQGESQLYNCRRILGSARALACNIRRLAECTTTVREIFQPKEISGEGAGNSTRGRVRSPEFLYRERRRRA